MNRFSITDSVVLGLVSVALLFVTGCKDPPEPRELTSLRRSGEATFLCLDAEGRGVPLTNCPQGPRSDSGGVTVSNFGYELHSLVTQTLSSEVGVVRLTGVDANGDSTGKVLDVDPSNPTVTPLRVGGQPTDIVTTPGGFASFVGIAEVGLEGIYALPTACILEPLPGQPRRDRTTWPACSLTSAPGDMVVIVDPASDGDEPRRWCGQAPADGLPLAPTGGLCATDLSLEFGESGSRKLVVALPLEGKLIVLDAQEILDRESGTYEACHVEAELALTARVPDVLYQDLPEDLRVAGADPWMTYDSLGGAYESQPAGMAVQDGRLLIADYSAPVVHFVDARDPCQLLELPPLIATSFLEPERVVTTSRVSLSPKTPSGTQVAYAIDEQDGPASLIPFDLSESAGSRLPLVRSGSALVVREAPDRLQFSAAVKDVAFALLDRPVVDEATGVGVGGISCDPDPDLPLSSLEAQYRPTNEDEGAQPAVLRGLFGYALLSSGIVSLIDIEDLDAACRRPVSLNTEVGFDFRGCSEDPKDVQYYTYDKTEDGTPTVSAEVSCRAVVPHRSRSQYNLVTDEDAGIGAPSLRADGQASRLGRSLSVSRLTPQGKKNPILLGTDFDAPGSQAAASAQVYIGNILYEREGTTYPLNIDANTAESISMVLPFVEPRAYPSTEIVSAIYEGDLDRTRPTGLFADPPSGDSTTTVLADENVSFCQLGVQDTQLTSEVAGDKFGLTGGAVSRFVERHTDYVQVTNLLFDETDPYWDAAGAQCGSASTGEDGIGYELCDSLFGLGDEEELELSRDFSVLSAQENALTLTPRGDGTRKAEVVLALRCCFPGSITYRVRAGHQWVVRGTETGHEHSVIVDASGGTDSCVFDRSPLAAKLQGRAYEVSSVKCDNTNPDDVDSCGVGLRGEDDVVCSYDATLGPVEVGGVGSECIFDGLTRRFVIYRGLEPTLRDMAFGMEVIGGFYPFEISLVLDSTIVLPVSLVPVPTFGGLGVVDSQNRGLMIVDLYNSQVAQSYF